MPADPAQQPTPQPHRLDVITHHAIVVRAENARNSVTCSSQMSFGNRVSANWCRRYPRLFAERFKTYADKVLQPLYDEMSSSPLTARFGRQIDLAAGIMIDSTVSHRASK